MLQTPWTIIFTIFIFTSGFFPATSENSTASNSTVLSHSDGAMTTTESVAVTMHHERGELTSRVKNSSELPEHLWNGTTESSESKKGNSTNCHLKDETKDMLNCFVLNDAATIQPTANVSQEVSIATNKTEEKTLTSNYTYPPKIFPQNKDVKSIDKADEATRKRLNHTFYETFTPKNNISSTTAMNKTSDEKDIDAVIPLVHNTSNIQNTAVGNNLEIAAQKSENKEGMSWGMIVLATMLTFAMAIAIIYASTIGRKRYLEYKYNNRQLLDNESEFDANDLHHFEL